MMVQKRGFRSGTTLLEVLIALAIMAMTALLIAPLISGTGRALGRSSEIADGVAMAISRDELRGWLEAAVAFPASDGIAPEAGFVGRQGSLEFFTLSHGGSFWVGEWVKVRLMTISGEEGQIVRVLAVGLDDQGNSVTRELPLSTTAGTISLEYFGRHEGETDPTWRNEWASVGRLPDLVRISIADRRMVYPPLIVSPGWSHRQSEMSLSSLVPPALPSRP